jgi:hypothetical protein
VLVDPNSLSIATNFTTTLGPMFKVLPLKALHDVAMTYGTSVTFQLAVSPAAKFPA